MIRPHETRGSARRGCSPEDSYEVQPEEGGALLRHTVEGEAVHDLALEAFLDNVAVSVVGGRRACVG